MATARDLLLVDGDLAVIGSDFALVYDNDAIAQQAVISLQTFAGEVFFDTAAGARWFDLLGVKGNGIDAQFAAECKRVLLEVPGIVSVQNVVVTRNSSRVGTISAQCVADSGVLLTINANLTQQATQ